MLLCATHLACSADQWSVISPGSEHDRITTIQETSYGGTEEDHAEAVQKTIGGGYVVAGWMYSFGSGSRNIWVLKLDQKGEIPDSQIMTTGETTTDDYEMVKISVLRLDMEGASKKLVVSIDTRGNLHLKLSGTR